MNSISSLQFFNIFRFVSTLLIGILMAKIGLATEEIALYELLFFLTTLVNFFWVMGGQNALLQYFPKLETAVQKSALFSVFALFTALSMLAAWILWVLQNVFFDFFNQGEPLTYLPLICWYIVFNTPTFLIHIFYLVLGQYRQLMSWGIFTFGGQLVAVILPLMLGYSLETSFQALLLLAIVRYIWAIQVLRKNAVFQIDTVFLQKYTWLLIPLMLQALIGSSAEYVDGLIVKANILDAKGFAIFRWGARELPVSLIFVNAVVVAMIPKVSENLEDGCRLMKQKIDELSRWLYPLSIVLMILSPLLFPVFYNADAAESARIFNVYLLILSSRVLLPQVIVMSQHKNYFLVVSAIFELLINVVLSLILVRYFGMVGIAFASVIAYLLDKIFQILYSQFVLKISLTRYISIGKYALYNSALLGSYFLVEMIY